MKLIVYKGFSTDFLMHLESQPLLGADLMTKKNVLGYDRTFRRQLEQALLSLEDEQCAWITYEEYAFIHEHVHGAVVNYGLELSILRNNLLPDYYPLEFDIAPNLAREIIDVTNGDKASDASEECKRFIGLKIYSALVEIGNTYYGAFYDYVHERETEIAVHDYYSQYAQIEDAEMKMAYTMSLNGDIDTYLRDIFAIEQRHPAVIGLRPTENERSRRFQKSLQAYCFQNGIRLVKFYEQLPEEVALDAEFMDIAKNIIRIEGFKEFKKIKFYESPDSSKKTKEISQAQLIREIVRQAEAAYQSDAGIGYRDVFVTASTGAGKSAIFQISAAYLAKKYQKITVVIEPIIALMQDQTAKLREAGYDRVEALNSRLATYVQKEEALRRIKNGEVDLLYLSPETLLSYSMETIVGEREIGLVIVDEAHTVTTWGANFRPDYWYLGAYLNKLRNGIKTSKGAHQKTFPFPICAFTATAVYGGRDDSVEDTVDSLYMENPVYYLGYVRRDDITFEFSHSDGQPKSKSEYDKCKCIALGKRIETWLERKEKTIVYFPWAAHVRDAYVGRDAFAQLNVDKEKIGKYAGRNSEGISDDMFVNKKDAAVEDFKNGRKTVMLATKAFGMGVDIRDIKNVYHYAASGSLSDYVQEIGRAARDPSMSGKAIMDCLQRDMRFSTMLFRISEIRRYQLIKVLEEIYNVYKSKKGARNFLISPEAFTYIFNDKEESGRITKLKTSLLMLENDLYGQYKVLIARPRSVFTKAFICIDHNHEEEVLASPYGAYIKRVDDGRVREAQTDGSLVTDMGDVYTLDMKGVWEQFYQNISFPQFKYWYFNANQQDVNKKDIMPSIRKYIFPRQKITIEAKGDLLLSELKERILQDFEYVANDILYTKFKKEYFAKDKFERQLEQKFEEGKARIIANSLFDLLDPEGRCVKRRNATQKEYSGETQYMIARGNFKDYMRRPIEKSSIMQTLEKAQSASAYTYISLDADDTSSKALKLLSIFGYATYEIVGGQEPEIFIRLNDPIKIENIIRNPKNYHNRYIAKAKAKHDRDIKILEKFFNGCNTDKERWDYIEDYFLGKDVLSDVKMNASQSVDMERMLDIEESDSAHSWPEVEERLAECYHPLIAELKESGIPVPEYTETTLKKTGKGKDILLSWPSKNALICSPDAAEETLAFFEGKGWHVYKSNKIDYDSLKEVLG